MADLATLPAGSSLQGYCSAGIVVAQAAVRFSTDRRPTMRLRHANLSTSDVSELADIFQRFFGFELQLQRANGFALLRDREDFVLTVMKRKKNDPGTYPEMFHIGFYCDSADLVRAKHAELAAAGLAPGDVETINRDGTVTTFYWRPSDGDVLIEVATQPGHQLT
jgi:catechol 2,3-dioxygenase-like lactoylglutathione lyase family enzyme